MFGCIVSFVIRRLSVPRYQRKQNPEPDPGHSSKMTPSCKWPLCVVFVSPRKKRPLDLRMTSSTRFDFKFFRVFSKYRLPGKLHFTIKVSTVIFSEGGYALSRSMTTATTFSRQNVAGSRASTK